MMRRRFDPSRRPPWWPDHEPWPSHRRSGRDRVVRLRFFRRFAVLAALMLMSALFGIVTLAWQAMSSLGIRVSLGSGRVGLGPTSAPGGSVAVSPQAASSNRIAQKGFRFGIMSVEPRADHEVPPKAP